VSPKPGSRGRRELKSYTDKVAVIDHLKGLINMARKLPVEDYEELDALLKRLKVFIRRVFGASHDHYKDFQEIHFPPKFYAGTEEFLEDWLDGDTKLLNLLKAMLEEIEVFGLPQPKDVIGGESASRATRVFLAHGHDEGMRESAARILEKIGCEVVMLREQTSESRTTAEQLEYYSSTVSYAVILLSPDDMAYPTRMGPSQARPRARQNVIDELGFFRGKLGRSNLFILYKKVEGFVKPSNIEGVSYVPYDELGHWKMRLASELQNRGHNVELSELIPRDAASLTQEDGGGVTVARQTHTPFD
jgi:predicted nucleotide-binding protein